jgi:ABC-type branched-subunit amino acid transport system substrate-binding protein
MSLSQPTQPSPPVNLPPSGNKATKEPRGCLASIILIFITVLLVSVTCVSVFYLTLSPVLLNFAVFAALVIPPIGWCVGKIPWFSDRYDQAEEKLDQLYKKVGKSSPSLDVKKWLFRITLTIVLLTISIVPYVVPAVPFSINKSIHDLLSGNKSSCYLCINTINGQKIGLSDGKQDHFWKEDADNNAERLIYQENARIEAIPDVHLRTMVVVAPLTEGNRYVYRDGLQGAYILQQMANEGTDRCLFSGEMGCVRVRIFIANAGAGMDYAAPVAQQILSLAQNDSTFLGVIGWPLSKREGFEGLNLLLKNNIPVISSSASSDVLSALSPYFFRLPPVDSEQGAAAARYEIQRGVKHVVIFYTPDSPYSQTLSTGFIREFLKQPGNTIFTETYSENDSSEKRNSVIDAGVDDALNGNNHPKPDLIYFAGYAEELSKLLNKLHATSFSKTPVLSGDAAYDVQVFRDDAYRGFQFASFAATDAWCNQPGVVCSTPDPCTWSLSLPQTSNHQNFFCKYKSTFDPDNKHPLPSQRLVDYGYSLANSNVILSFDTAYTLINGYVKSKGQSPTRETVAQTLRGFNVCHPLQGVSGQIAFGPDGDAIGKPILLMDVDNPPLGQEPATSFLSIMQGQLISNSSALCV